MSTGEQALVRLAGLPVGLWTAGGAPELFATAHALGLRRAAHTTRARALAALISDTLVPHPAFSGAERRTLIELRRALAAGRPPTPPVLAAARTLLAAPTTRITLVDALARARRELAETLAEGAAIAEAEAAYERAVTAEAARTADLGWRTLRTAGPGAAELLAEDPDLVADVLARLARGERWTDKRLRTRADHLWRLLGRACVKTTPRSWLGHLAVLPVAEGAGDGGADSVGGLLSVDVRAGAHAVHRMQNVHATAGADAGADTDGTVRLSTTGLCRRGPDRVACWTVHPTDPSRLHAVGLRATPLLNAVLDLLDTGPRTRAEVLDTLLPAGTAANRRAVLAEFLTHLVGLGLLQERSVPRQTLTAWPPPADAFTDTFTDGFTDVYRHARGRIDAVAAQRIRAALGTARRLAALRPATPPAPHPVLALVDEVPRPVPELLAAFLDARPDWTPPPAAAPRWPLPAPGAAGGAYGRLLDLVRAHALRRPEEPFRVDAELLDALGADPGTGTGAGPVDCLLHPLPVRAPGDPAAVLEGTGPAARLDARFAPALRRLHGHAPGVDAHRALLARTEPHADGRFVEVLVPPLRDRAANAVRRPRYTGLWTGDGDPAAYHDEDDALPGGSERIPLHRITVRRDADDRIVVEGPDGRTLWPVHHATRAALPPWDVVLALLTSSPNPLPVRGLGFGGLANALPELDRLPRIVADDTLVLGRAGWRVPQDETPDPLAPWPEKLRAVAAWTRRRGLPRFVFATAVGGRRPVPVDLASLPGVRQLERLARAVAPDPLYLEEMLPAPDDALVRDTAPGTPTAAGAAPDRLIAQLLLRFTGSEPVARPGAQRSAHASSTPPRPDATSRGPRDPVDSRQAPTV
ncbi:lantibiotic dehydratase (plasmid) [Streptomyces sp. BI20]|uniref:lantibiotic dehydratase n=1 Tax=Streptomyces sp. BI20 TaxID=3403460 RepID=UPI003C75C94F